MEQKFASEFCSWTLKRSLVLMLFILHMHIPHQVYAAEEIILATQISSTFTDKGQPIIQCAFKKIGHSLKIEKVPWNRAQIDTRNGKYSGFFMATQNRTRDAYATFTQPFIEVKWVYVVRKKSNITLSNADFEQKIFAANNGTSRLIWLLEQHKNNKIAHQIFKAESTITLLRMMLLNRMDIILENTANLERAAAENQIDMSEFKILPAQKKPMAVYFSHSFLKRNPTFLMAYNTAIVTCKTERLD
ncbi:MAG: transporter substrate-binding domain-containing protein [Sneathiella sp.]|nr:transporter substrate-binding domain-containing protein [Sneathiella sp.]